MKKRGVLLKGVTMKKLKRNAYWISCLAIIASLAVNFALPDRIGQSQEPEPASPAAVFTVTNNLDAGAGSFRQAIIDANAAAGLDTIQFAIGTGPVDIILSSALPDITQPVIIDGTTQPGFSGTPLIRLAFNSIQAQEGLRITGGGSTVRALAITSSFRSLTLENGGGNTITGTYIGICPQNPMASCGNAFGVRIVNSPNNRIGGSTVAERNIISGNNDRGIEITGGASAGNIITGSYIGLHSDGTLAPNDNFGVAIIGAPNNRVGGSLSGERNVISGNAGLCNLPLLANNSDVFISGAAATGNTVAGNYIGTTIDGMDANSPCVGVRIDNAPNNTIGGTVGTTPGGACTGSCNLISGYGGIGNQSGVTIAGSGSAGNSVLGNFIGTNAAGTARVNNDVGVTITNGASNNTVGGTTAAARNLINNGITLSAGAAANTVQGNYIGTDTTGNTGIGFIPGGGSIAAVTIANAPNNQIGTATGTTLGGACTGGCNLISGNNLLGVRITGAASTGNRVDYNYIGLNAAGTTALRNGGDAITLLSGANNNTIGRPMTATPLQAVEKSYQDIQQIRVVQNDVTGDYIRFDDATGQYWWNRCQSGLGEFSGTGEVRTIFGDTLQLSDYGVVVSIDINTGKAGATINPPPDSLLAFFIITDSDTSNSTPACPTEGRLTMLGSVTNAANSNTFNLISVGSSANGLVNLASLTADGNFFNQSGSFNFYSYLFITTNGGNFPAVEIGAGNDNVISDLNVTARNPGQYANRPVVLQLGANRNIAPVQNLGVIQETGGVARVIGNFSGIPNTNYRISISGFNQTTTSSGSIVTQVIPTGTTFLIRTNANGNYNIDQFFTGPDAFALLNSERVAAVITQINAVPITSEGSTSFVDVPGDTSEMSALAVVPRPKFDFDDDGKTDISVWRPSDGNWHISQSTDGYAQYTWGSSGDLIVPFDFDGDNRADVAVWRPSNGTWYILNSFSGTYRTYTWGAATDIPVPGDYDDDGRADVAVYRPSTGTWYILKSLGGNKTITWGSGSDVPIVGDFDGDGQTDIAVRRPSTGQWFINRSSSGFVTITWGVAADRPVHADYDRDGKTDVAVWRPSTGDWFILNSNGGPFTVYTWGAAGDVPVIGDYDGDGRDDIGVYRNGIWYVLQSTSGYRTASWGNATDVAVPGKYTP